MKLTINGTESSIQPPCTVAQLLERLGLGAAPCAVEVNRMLVPKRQHPTHAVQDGDAVEIVTLVGGG